jgi:hypothetical protein
MENRNLKYGERWFLAYGETLDEFFDKNPYVIPACDLEDRWDKHGIPKTTKELREIKWKN